MTATKMKSTLITSILALSSLFVIFDTAMVNLFYSDESINNQHIAENE